MRPVERGTVEWERTGRRTTLRLEYFLERGTGGHSFGYQRSGRRSLPVFPSDLFSLPLPLPLPFRLPFCSPLPLQHTQLTSTTTNVVVVAVRFVPGSHRKQGFCTLPLPLPLPLHLPLVFAVAVALSLPFAMALAIAMTRIGHLGFELVPCCVLRVACCVLRAKR